MAKFENYRYKALTVLEKIRDCLWKTAVREKQRENRKFSSFRFLEYAGLDIESAVERDNRAAFKNARAVLVISVLMTATGFMLSSNVESLADVLQRPEYGEGSKEAQIEVTIEAGGMNQSSLVPIKIKEKALTAAEASVMFDSCEEWLRTALFEGQPPYKLNSSLNLPKESEDGLVQIVWESSREELVSSAGEINTIGLKDAETAALKAVLLAEDFSREIYFNLSVEPSETSLVQSLNKELKAVISNMELYMTEDRLNLPNSSPKGAYMTWVLPGRQVPVFIIFFGSFMALAIFFSRHDRLEKQLKKMKQEFENNLPDLSLQLILMLNAGLVTSAAFKELEIMHKDTENPLYGAISALQRESEETNTPFVSCLYSYAADTGCRDFIRFANLVLSNSSSGSELSDKLERERNQQWNSRLSAARAKAKEAETKLCLPLTLLLGVLVVISVSPALLEM